MSRAGRQGTCSSRMRGRVRDGVDLGPWLRIDLKRTRSQSGCQSRRRSIFPKSPTHNIPPGTDSKRREGAGWGPSRRGAGPRILERSLEGCRDDGDRLTIASCAMPLAALASLEVGALSPLAALVRTCPPLLSRHAAEADA